MTLTRDALASLAERPLKPEPVVTPFGTVHVPRLTAAGLTAFLDKVEDKDKGAELVLVLVDEYGTPLFGAEDADLAARLPAELTVPASRRFQEINGLRPKASASTADSPTG
jgi:hypothetical protein